MSDYFPAIKVRLSGVTERSDGSGRDRRTVVHARAARDLSMRGARGHVVTRLRVPEGRPLCLAPEPLFSWGHARGPVTCKRCLAKIAECQLTEGPAPETITDRAPWE